MSMQDPIADMLTRIRNGLKARHPNVSMPSSTQKLAIAKVLVETGYIDTFDVDDSAKPVAILTVKLKYDNEGVPIITGIKRISRPGLRVYRNKDELPKTSGGFGISIISTSAGVLSNSNARKQQVGGEVWCQVW